MNLIYKRLGVYIVLYFYEELRRWSHVKTEWTYRQLKEHAKVWPELRSFASCGFREVVLTFNVFDSHQRAEEMISVLCAMCLHIDDAHYSNEKRLFPGSYVVPDEVLQCAQYNIMNMIVEYKCAAAKYRKEALIVMAKEAA